MNTTDTNPFRHAARLEKSKLLVRALDMAFASFGEGLPEAQFAAVEGMADHGWAAASAVAGCSLPSPETRELVIAEYRERVRVAEVSRCIAGALKSAGGGR